MQVPFVRGVWFIKMTAAYALAMSESNKAKKRQLSDPTSEWTGVLVRFLKEQLIEMSNLVQGQGSGGGGSSGSGNAQSSSAIGLGDLFND